MPTLRQTPNPKAVKNVSKNFCNGSEYDPLTLSTLDAKRAALNTLYFYNA